MQTSGADSDPSPEGNLERLPLWRRRLRGKFATVRWLPALGVGLALTLVTAGVIAWLATHALRLSTEEVRSEGQIPFTFDVYRAPANTGFETLTAPAVFVAAAEFQNQFYIAGPAGLLVYDLRGEWVRQFAVGLDLPSSPLVAMATAVLADSGRQELVIATAGEGLLVYDGSRFRQIYPQDGDARAITTILPASDGHLLIGTKKRGVLLYDGKQIKAIHPTLSGLYVQSLAGTESDLWVGTLDRGVLHWHAGATDSFGEVDGLPDRRVQTILAAGDQTFVGTVAGVAEFDGGRFSRVLAPRVLTTALLRTQENLVVGSEDQGVAMVPLEAAHRLGLPGGQPEELSEIRQLLREGTDVYVLTSDALYRTSMSGQGWQRVLRPGPAELTDSNISALATDGSGRLWVGYFDRGLDELEMGSGRTMHVEDDHVFCVNRILPDVKTGTVVVATANGLVRFGSGSERQVLTRADGLIADHVTDVAVYRGGLAVATPAGLTYLDASGARSIYAFQGLVNNHVYTLGVSGDQLLAGTLGGLSVIHDGDVQTSYTTSTSDLKHNWITAVAPVGDEWMVGTYGAGVVAMDGTGHFRSLEGATGPVEVNPNAMLVTSRHVFAGTLGNGLYVEDRSSGRWSVVKEGLPSVNVTALAESNGTIYVGTDNGLVRVREEKFRQ